MLLPAPRGPMSRALIDALHDGDFSRLPDDAQLPAIGEPLADDDLQLALWVATNCTTAASTGRMRASSGNRTSSRFVRRRGTTARRAAARGDGRPDDRPVADRLRLLVENDRGPQLSRFIQTKACYQQFVEFVVQRSIYQVKEADPHSWAIPRLSGKAKAALVQIQVDEYGDGNIAYMHSELYRALLRGLELDDTYGAYLDVVPGITLAISNVMSMFGLRRELRGALVGHLAAYEMTSSAPCRRYAKGLRRLGVSDDACAFYDVHVTADALHEQLAAHDLCGGLADAEPALTEDILFGAAACLHVDNRFAAHVMNCWTNQETSLREPNIAAPTLRAVS